MRRALGWAVVDVTPSTTRPGTCHERIVTRLEGISKNVMRCLSYIQEGTAGSADAPSIPAAYREIYCRRLVLLFVRWLRLISLALLWQKSAEYSSPLPTTVRTVGRRRLTELAQDRLPDSW